MIPAGEKVGEDGAEDGADGGCTYRKLYNMEVYHGRVHALGKALVRSKHRRP